MATNKRKTTTTIIAGVTAAALLLGGTFAWTSISQQAKNESAGIVNVGGRLHDDFNGENKDVYVENFTDSANGGQPIYARVRLDEYMEVGSEAGQADNADRKATPVVANADINDVETWSPHVPAESCNVCNTGETCKIHTYWEWDMGNEEAKVFMPTFNKDKDSLDADINGTYAGTNPDDKVYYDDYVTYVTENGAVVSVIENTVDATAVTIPEGATGANALTEANKEVSQVTGNAIYDNDADTEKNEIENDDYITKEETHTAKQTATAEVITMEQWLSEDTANGGKSGQPGNYWVYDTDGWAYWANPIMPGETTGLLLNGIKMTSNPGEKCYYAINVVGQFATVGDWEYFEGDGELNENAKLLLETASKNVPTVTVSNTSGVKKVERGETYEFTPNVSVNGVNMYAATDFEWSVLDENMEVITEGTTIQDGKLTVATDETSKTLTIVARAKDYLGAAGRISVAVNTDVKTIDDMSANDYVLLTENGTNDAGEATYTLAFVRSNDEVTTEYTYQGAAIHAVYENIESQSFSTYTDAPWEAFRNSITHVNIENTFQSQYANLWFYKMSNLQTLEGASKLDTSKITSMRSMFSGCSNLTALELSGWKVDSVTDMSYMFNGCTNLTTVGDLSNWDVIGVKNMTCMFFECKKLQTVGDLSNWKVDNVTDMSHMFRACNFLKSVGELDDWNVGNVKSMYAMFHRCFNLTTLGDLGNWDVSNVTNLGYMFHECHGFTTLGDIGKWDTSNVTNLEWMFAYCSNLVADLSSWDVSNVTERTFFAQGAGNITKPTWVN